MLVVFKIVTIIINFIAALICGWGAIQWSKNGYINFALLGILLMITNLILAMVNIFYMVGV